MVNSMLSYVNSYYHCCMMLAEACLLLMLNVDLLCMHLSILFYANIQILRHPADCICSE